MKLQASNPSTKGLEKSFLSTALSAGVTTFDVKNDNLFQPNQVILIGEMGQERSEMVTIQAAVTPGTTLTLTAPTVFPHDADTPVYALKYDKVKFYRSTAGLQGAYNLLTTVPLDVDNANLLTIYDDVAGLTSYYYELSFSSTFDGSETALSDPIAGSGYPRGTAGALINEFFESVSDTTQQNMSVKEAIDLINEVNDDLISQSRRPFRFLKTSKLLDIAANNPRIPLPTDLVKFERMLYTNAFDKRVDEYQNISMQEMEYINYDNTMVPSDNLLYISIDESTNELVLFPTPATSSVGSVKVFYWRKFKEVTSLAAQMETPNTRIYKLFLTGRYYRKRAVKEPTFNTLAQQYLADYNTEVVKLQRAQRLDMGTPMSIKPDTHHSRGLKRY
jgi:hypothetical protein